MIRDVILVGVGGFIGSALRYMLSSLVVGALPSAIPLGTVTVNVLGSFIIGLLMTMLSGGTWYYICIIGFCGGFTTFSTFSAEMLTMIRTGHYSNAAIYVGASVVICVAAVAAGLYLGQKFNLKL